MWTILQILVLTANYELFQTTIIALAIAHCLLQPYCKKWLNIVDGVLLGFLVVTATLVLVDKNPYFFTNKVVWVLVYISVMGPLCLISLGIVAIVLVRFGIWSKVVSKCSAINWHQQLYTFVKDRNVSSQNPRLNIVSRSILTGSTGTHKPTTSTEREPLIRYLQESADIDQ